MVDYYLKQHDSGPVLQAVLSDSVGPENLSGASVRFLMKSQSSGGVKVNQAATIVDAANGIVSYQPTTSDTDTVGTFFAEWEVTYPDGTVQTYPNTTYQEIRIVADVA